MFVIGLQVRMDVNYLLVSAIHEAEGSNGAVGFLCGCESRCWQWEHKGGQRGKAEGHIHYLHTQAASRSTSRRPDRSDLRILGARSQLRS